MSTPLANFLADLSKEYQDFFVIVPDNARSRKHLKTPAPPCLTTQHSSSSISVTSPPHSGENPQSPDISRETDFSNETGYYQVRTKRESFAGKDQDQCSQDQDTTFQPCSKHEAQELSSFQLRKRWQEWRLVLRRKSRRWCKTSPLHNTRIDDARINVGACNRKRNPYQIYESNRAKW